MICVHEETDVFCPKSQDGIITKLQYIIDNTDDEDYLLLTFEDGEDRDGKLQCIHLACIAQKLVVPWPCNYQH